MATNIDKFVTPLEHDGIDHTGITGVNPAQVSSGERTLGTETALRSFSPADVKVMADIGSAKSTSTLHIDVVRQSTNTTGATTDLQTYTLPANTLASDGDTLEIEASGEFIGNAAGAIAIFSTISFGSALIGNALGIGTDPVTAWTTRVVISRRGASNQYSFFVSHLLLGGGIPKTMLAVPVTPTEALGSPIVIKVSGGISSTSYTGNYVHVDRFMVRSIPV